MPSPATRLLAALELLQARGQISGAELAARLEVDRRTVRRYIARLEELGIPVVAERGRHGAYALVAGFKLPPMMFTDDEALALAVGLSAARGLGLAEVAPAVVSAAAKLERVLPANLRGQLKGVLETTVLELAQPAPARAGSALAALAVAALGERRVRLTYRSREGQATTRDFDPFGLAYRKGCWYAVGHCHLRQGLRSFRLDRVVAVEPAEETFRRPRGFDPLRQLAAGIATIPRAIAVEVLLKTDLARAQAELGDSLGLFEPIPEGLLYRSMTDDLDWYARQLARLPFPFEVRRPVALSAALRARAAELLACCEPAHSAGP